MTIDYRVEARVLLLYGMTRPNYRPEKPIEGASCRCNCSKKHLSIEETHNTVECTVESCQEKST